MNDQFLNDTTTSAKPLNPLVIHHYQGCIDLHGQAIPHGLLFAPGPDECQVCTCVNGAAGYCRTVLCAPPQNCQSLRVGDQCCQWICLDDIHPHGGSNFDLTNNNIHGAADIKLRLITSAITAILSLALLFFLIYRLRKKRMQNRNSRQRHSDDEMSVDSCVNNHQGSYPMTGVNPPQRNYPWYSNLAWWKNSNSPNMFEGRIAPPSYDDAMMQANCHSQSANVDGECSSLESSGSEAPPYSEIHLDPIVPDTYYGQIGRNAPQVSVIQPNLNPNVPIGATLVLPVPAPNLQTLNHVETNESNNEILVTDERDTQSNLPQALRRMRARSREGIVVPPNGPDGDQDISTQRYSLQLNLSIASESGSSSNLSSLNPNHHPSESDSSSTE